MIRRLVAMALLGGAPAQAAGLYGQFWGDALPLPSSSEQRRDLQLTRVWLCPVTAGAGGSAADTSATQALRDAIAALDKDDPARAALEQALKGMKGTQTPRTAPAPRPAPLTFAQALNSARTWLARHEAAGMKALDGSPEGKSAALANALAMQTSVAGRPEAALAALLSAHTLAPKNADTLVNLGGVLATLNLPAEALAVLTEAQRVGIPKGGPMGVPMEAVALNNAGRALLHQGRYAEAGERLRRALTLAPQLTEAHENLAQALLCQGQTDNAVLALRHAARRTPSTPGTPRQELPGSPAGGEPPATGTPPPTQGESRRPARQSFDLSHGQSATLPDLKIAQTPAEAVQLLDRYRALDHELTERVLALTRQQEATELQLRGRNEGSPATAARRRAIWAALISSDDEPQLRALKQRSDRLEHEIATIWGDFWHCEGGCTIAQINEQAHGDERVFRALCVPQLQADHERWKNAMHAYAHDLGGQLSAEYRYHTALAANYSDPLWHRRAALQAEIVATGQFSSLVHHAMLWAADIRQFNDVCVGGRAGPAPASVAAALVLPAPPTCKQMVGPLTTSLSIGMIDASFSCDKASLKVAPSGLLAQFVKVELDTSAERWKTTVIAGIQGGGGLQEVLGLGVKASVGAYVALSRDGFEDVGMVGEVKSSMGLPLGEKMPIGQLKVGESARAISARWSFVSGTTAFDLGH